MARYANKRPDGLKVDSHGQFSLKNLMEVWGDEQGVQAKDIIEAVYSHMYQSEKEKSIRYTLHTDESSGDMIIKVHPKKNVGRRWDRDKNRKPDRTQISAKSMPSNRNRGAGQRGWAKHPRRRNRSVSEDEEDDEEEEEEEATGGRAGQKGWAKHQRQGDGSVTEDEDEDEEEEEAAGGLVKEEPQAEPLQEEEEGDGGLAHTWAKQEPSDAEEVSSVHRRRGHQRHWHRGPSWNRNSSWRR